MYKRQVLIHGLVRDSQGRKMSKSLGNGIDPLEVIDKYGADALRFTLITGNAPGNDMRFYWERAVSYTHLDVYKRQDVGLANPQALVVATSAADAVHRVGMPEAQIILSEAVIYVATSPKSNGAYNAIFSAMSTVTVSYTHLFS